MQVPLQVSAWVVLDGQGDGVVTLGPELPGTSWNPASCGVKVTPTSTTTVSEFFLYLGGVSDENFIGGTYTGDINSSAVTLPAPLTPGQILTGRWTGGNPGATATLTLSGQQTIGG